MVQDNILVEGVEKGNVEFQVNTYPYELKLVVLEDCLKPFYHENE